ncbi:MAG: hypothetical protein Q4D60_00715 [Eubacteriales bacterium]|nr:hypothetical protein [Eubacteriales bacterium]
MRRVTLICKNVWKEREEEERRRLWMAAWSVLFQREREQNEAGGKERWQR